jgi:hypothetical protein
MMSADAMRGSLSTMRSRTTLVIVAVVAVAAVAGLLWYLNRPVAEQASIDNALQAVEPSDAPAPTVAEQAGDVSGTWTVTTEIGEFDFGDATSTFVGFRVDEELATVGQTEAIGRTPAVSGELVLDGTTVTAVDVTADLTQMVSDVPRREGAMRRAMGVDANPTATFSLTQPIELDGVPADGETVMATGVGDLTVNGTTAPIEVELEARLVEGDLLVVGRTPVTFADFGITAPQAGPVVSIEQEGTVELQLWFVRA